MNESDVVGGDVRLRTISNDELARIRSFHAANASLGTKIDTVLRHIQAIKADDAEAKIVVFTCFLDALDFFRAALEVNGISSIRLEGGKNRAQAAQAFANDAGISVFLLHSTSQAAGLNLTAASTVILFEPLLHPGLELQAVGRVHRIGQTKPTRVYQYYVEDSVDERIALLQARKGRSLFVDDAARDAMDEDDQALFADAVASPRKASGGNEDATDDAEDLAACLFAARERRTLQACLVAAATATHD